MEMTKSLNYVDKKAWTFKESGNDQICLEYCPLCSHDNFKFYMAIGGEKDGLWDCKICGEHGNLTALMKQQGDKLDGILSYKDSVEAATRAEQMPDINGPHRRLLEDEDALDYLVHERGFTMAVIERFKLGLDLGDNNSRWLVIPYLHRSHTIFVKYRSLPPAEKAFRGIKGREAPLFNMDCITKDMPELLFVEGESDCLSCISNGIEAVVGVPGANTQKTSWIKAIDDANIKRVYLLYDNDKVGQTAAKAMAHKIGIEKCFNILLPEFVTGDDGKRGKDINEWFVAGHTQADFDVLKSQARPFDVEGVVSAGECLDEIEASFNGEGELVPAIDTPWPSLTKRLGGVEWGDLIGVMAEGKVGKVGPLDSKVLIPNGWSKMSDLIVGQMISSVDGQASTVEAIYPQGMVDFYKFTFSDGRTAEVGLNHLWQVGSVTNFGRDGFRVIDTKTLLTYKNINDWFIPLYCGEWQSEKRLPITPWLLGALIGDGGLTQTSGVSFTKTDPLVVSKLTSELNLINASIKRKSYCSYYIGQCTQLKARIKKLNLNCLSYSKFIPEMYKNSSRQQRLALLQGLMDTDGSVEGKYAVPCFNTSSEQLAKDVQELVWSLGGIAKITSRVPTYTYKGKKLNGQKAYRILIKLNNDACFVNSHKAIKECIRTRESRLTIESIEFSRKAEGQCIKVSHPSQLYIMDNFTVTHNTTMALNWLEYYSCIKGFNTLMFCLEMAPKRMVRKWMSHVTGTDDTPGRSQIRPETVQAARKHLLESPGEMLFGSLPNATRETAFDLIRQAVRRYGVKIVCFDNLQYLARSMTHQTQELGNLSKGFKDLAVELGIVIILIIQPNRVRDGEIVAARNANGSSAIEKDVDAMITAHRNRVAQMRQEDLVGAVETDDNFEPMLYGDVNLSRYAPGGRFMLFMEGGTSTVRELSDLDKGAMPKFQFANEVPIEA